MNSELLEKYKELAKQNLIILALGLVGLTLFAYGLISLFLASKATPQDIVFESNSAKQNKNDDVKANSLTVDVEGAVVKPGVYNLPQGSRIQDALVASGGLSASADRDFIAKTINLATKLSDGAKIYIPKIGEDVKITDSIGITSATGSIANSQININTANEQVLDSLPGIGSVTAQKIIGARPYTSIEDLLSKKIVGSKVFDQIKDKITIY